MPLYDEDFLRIETMLGALAAQIGASSVMDIEDYVEPERGREGVQRPLPLRQRVVAEVKALERHLALLDRATYLETLETIRGNYLKGSAPVELQPLPGGVKIAFEADSGFEPLDLGELPDLDRARATLAHLAGQLAEN